VLDEENFCAALNNDLVACDVVRRNRSDPRRERSDCYRCNAEHASGRSSIELYHRWHYQCRASVVDSYGRCYLSDRTTVPTAVLSPNWVTLNDIHASSVGDAGSSAIAPTLTIYVPANIPVGNLTIAIAAAAGIKNPSVAKSYTLSVATTVESTPVNSSPYTITPAIANVTVSVDPPSAGQAAAYTVSFTAGSAIAAGSYITLAFPTGTTVPASLLQIPSM